MHMGPLTGLKILDFSTLLPGPFATMMLADLGADVLHVEAPGKRDVVKDLKPILESGNSASYEQLNRGKKTISIDLKSDEGKAKVHELLGQYDIVVEQFRPGVMERLGFGYEQLKTAHPALIYCSITGYGQTGPLAAHAGHDINYLALTGIANAMRRDGEKPVASAMQIADLGGGALHAVIGILTAYIERLRTGVGRHLDISMFDAALSLHPLFGPMQLATNEDIAPEAEELNGGSFYDYYETSDSRYIAVGSLELKFQQRLAELLEIPDWFEQSIDAQKALLTAAFQQKTFAQWQQLLVNESELCVTPVLTFLEATKQPHAQARGLVTGVQVNSPLHFTEKKGEMI